MFNSADTAICLENRQLNINGSDISNMIDTVDARSYIVFARQLISEGGGASFEGYWGDSSGLWGDDAVLESYHAIDLDFTLPNDAGFIAVMDTGSLIDFLSWNLPASDGISIERDTLRLQFSGWHFSTDSSGSTPGRPNSPIIAPIQQEFSIAVMPRLASISAGGDFEILIEGQSGLALEIDILDDTGRKIRTLASQDNAAPQSILWRGDGKNGGALSPGIYFIYAKISGAQNITRSIPVVIAP